jgi:hypothetical protein
MGMSVERESSGHSSKTIRGSSIPSDVWLASIEENGGVIERALKSSEKWKSLQLLWDRYFGLGGGDTEFGAVNESVWMKMKG